MKILRFEVRHYENTSRVLRTKRDTFLGPVWGKVMQLFDAAARRQNHLDNALKARARDAWQQAEAKR